MTEIEIWELAAQRCRYYLKHQGFSNWDGLGEYARGVTVACNNLEEEFLKRAGSKPKEENV